MAVVGPPIWAPGVWADTVWAEGVWVSDDTPGEETPSVALSTEVMAFYASEEEDVMGSME